MSRNPQNNHYHYAEKFEDKNRRAAHGKRAYMPFNSVIISLVLLLVFGFICTTFAAYVSENEPQDASELSPIISAARSMKADRDVAFTGANADLAETGWTWMTMNGGGYFIFDNTNTGWDDVQMFVGRENNYGSHNTYCAVYNMTAISNTNFYYVHISDWSTSGDGTHIEQIIFVSGASSWSSNNENPNTRAGYASHRSAVFSSSFSFSSTGVYACEPNTSSTPTVTITTTATSGEHAGYNYFNYYQQIRSNTSTDGSTFAQNNNGGLISFSAIRLTANDTARTAEDETGKFRAVKHSTVTLTATPNSGYRFYGWYDSGGTQLTNGTTYTISTNATTGISTLSYTCSGTNEIHAYFLRQYTVSVANMSGCTSATMPTGGGTVDAGQNVTVSATTPTGVNFTGWTVPSGASYTDVTGTSSSASWTLTPASDFTVTANYTLTAPSISSFAYDHSAATTEGSNTALMPSITAASAAGNNGSLSYSYSVVSEPSGTSYSFDDDSSSVTNGEFSSPTIAGTYTVRVTVSDSAYGLSSSSTTAASAVTGPPAVATDATITVKPVAPVRADFTYLVENWTDDYTPGTTGETYSLPIKVPINSDNFKITAWLTSTNANYTYNWNNVFGTYNTSTGAVTTASTPGPKALTNNYRVVDICTDNDTALKVDSDGHYAYVINVVSSRNGVDSDALTFTLYYDVISDFIDIQWMSFTNNTNDYQKIYAEDNGITQIKSSIRVGGSTFNSLTWFSNDNILYKPIEIFGANYPIQNSFGTYTAAKPNDATHQTAAKQESFDVTNAMGYSGTKWLRVYINDTGNNKTASATRYIHTTVGTSSTVSDRPIYYVDSSGVTLTDTRVMAFYMTSDDNEAVVHYQTAQKVSGRTNTYRFYIPSDTTKITFAHISNNVNVTNGTNTYYLMPDYNNGTLTFSLPTGSPQSFALSTALKAWSPTLDLTTDNNQSKNTYFVNSRTQSDGIYYYSSTNGTDLTTLD